MTSQGKPLSRPVGSGLRDVGYNVGSIGEGRGRLRFLCLLAAVDADVVNLQNHLDELRRQADLLLLADESFNNALLAHVIGALLQAVNAKVGVLLQNLAAAHFSERFDWGKAAVLGKGHGDGLEGIGKGAHGILLERLDLISLLGDGEAACNLSSTASIDDTRVADEVADYADGVVQTTLGLSNNHLVATADEDGDSLGVLALLDDKHAVLGGAKGNLTDATSLAKLLSRKLFKAGNNAATRGDSNELDLGAANPADSGEALLQQEVVGLVVEAPLANGECCAGVLDLLDHLGKLALLVVPEFLKLLSRGDLHLVRRLGLWGLKRASENSNFGVVNLLDHLRVANFLVQHNTVDELAVLKAGTNLAINLDELKIDIASLHVCDRENGIDGHLGKLAVTAIDDLRAKRRHSSGNERLTIILVHLVVVRNLVKALERNGGGHLKAVGNADGMQTTVEKLLGHLKESASKDDDAGGAVTNLIVLALGKLDHELGNLVADIKVLEDSGAVVGDSDLAVGADENLVKAAWAQ
eukprot:m.9769 g.9769  ORF g.9769 m.9769 type:complete len:527 (-) comp3015_c0_seq2:171-1751(-)